MMVTEQGRTRGTHRSDPLAEGVKGRRVLVVGLGRSGRAAARHLLAEGAEVAATDNAPLESLPAEVRALESAGVRLTCGTHDEADFAWADLIVVSPGVPLEIPPLAAAVAAGTPLLSEVDLVARRVAGRAIGITGSNGKSTVTALVAAMLEGGGLEALACGNYGLPLVDAVQGDSGSRWYAIELSSFQLATTRRLRLEAAVILNVQPDHLDRHGSFEAYAAAKESIAERRSPDAPLVLVVDDSHLATFAERANPPLLRVSGAGPVDEGGFEREGDLFLRLAGRETLLARGAELPIPGRHNRLNILSAALACASVGVGNDEIRKGLAGFRALPHRLETVATIDGVLYVDDSKATNVASSIEALSAIGERIEGRVLLLLGGRDKDGDFRPLARAMRDQTAQPIVFGEAGPTIAETLREEGLAPPAPFPKMVVALHAARSLASRGDAVLLSPACASFDEFKGYADRGDHFARAVRELGGAR